MILPSHLFPPLSSMPLLPQTQWMPRKARCPRDPQLAIAAIPALPSPMHLLQQTQGMSQGRHAIHVIHSSSSPQSTPCLPRCTCSSKRKECRKEGTLSTRSTARPRRNPRPAFHVDDDDLHASLCLCRDPCPAFLGDAPIRASHNHRPTYVLILRCSGIKMMMPLKESHTRFLHSCQIPLKQVWREALDVVQVCHILWCSSRWANPLRPILCVKCCLVIMVVPRA
jgi:hypothetical protein